MTGGQAPHEVLGVAKDANTLQIVSAYRRLAWHPDRNRENPQAKAYFQEIHLAYTALMKEKSPKRLRQQWNAALMPKNLPKNRTAAVLWKPCLI